jgi:hypothetical protein
MKRAPPSEDSGATSGADVAGAGADSSTFELVRVGESVGGAEDTSETGVDSSTFELARVGESVVGAEAASGAEDSASAGAASTFAAAAFFAAAFFAGAFFAGASPSAGSASTFLTAAFFAAAFFAGLTSSGWASRFSPSRSALRRTRSACASSMEDDTLRTSIPISFDRSSASLFVRPSSLASSAIRIFLTAKG